MTFVSNHDNALDRFNEVIAATYAEGVSLMRKIELEALADVIKKSPVRAGLYRASHDLTVDTPSALAEGKIGGESQHVADGRRRLSAGLTASRLQGKGEITSFVTNNLPYANRLENGHSQQAPNGVYRLAEIRIQRLFNREAARLSRKTKRA